MSKSLLREFFELCEGGFCSDLLTEQEKLAVKNGALYLTGVIQRADARNGNGRIYPHSVLSREMDTYKQLVQERRALGELDHPDQSIINLKNVSHLVTEVWWSGKDVMGKIQVLNTPSGQVLRELVNANVKIGISSRGTGSVRENRGETIVEDDFQLICFDIVSEPSTHGAFMFQERKGNVNENKQARVSNLIKDILK
jgi:hypothetical protein